MIKRFWFVLAGREGEPPWREALEAPPGIVPVRLTVSDALADLESDPPWARIGTAWFTDPAHVQRFEGWASGTGDDGTESVVAHEVVVRGSDWLDRRWADGGSRLKHLAVARRRSGLTAEELSERWRSHAGHVGSTPIPDVARGQAYVQDHPLARADGDWPWDAVTEVWFDSLDGLRARIAWMTEELAEAPPDDLFGERHLLAVHEQVLSR